MRRHLLILAALMGLCGLIETVAIYRSTVPALDAARFLTEARLIDDVGLLPAMRQFWEQPLFPVWVWVVRHALGWLLGDGPALAALSVQLAAAIPLVLAVVPLYCFSLRIYGPAAALAGTVLFCAVPEVGRLGAYGISDSTHLLLFCLAVWPVVVYFTVPNGRGTMARVDEGTTRPATARGWNGGAMRRPLWLLAAGLALGAALMARTEAVVLPAAVALTLALFQCHPARRQPWWALVAAGGCLVAGMAAILGPYVLLMGAATPAAAVARILGQPEGKSRAAAESAEREPSAAQSAWQLSDGRPMSFVPKNTATSGRHRGYPAALARVGAELVKSLWYWVGLLGVYGVWRVRGTAGGPVDWFVRLFLALYLAIVIVFAAREGYASARHLLPWVAMGVGCCGFGAVQLGRRLTAALPGRLGARGAAGAALVTLLAAGACLVPTLKSISASAVAHRQAGQWLAERASATDAVVDTWGWSGLYSGRRMYMYREGPAAFDDPNLAYVVLEPQELAVESARTETLRALLGTAGELAALFSGPNAGDDTVAVYRWHPERWRAEKGDSHARVSASVRPECRRSL